MSGHAKRLYAKHIIEYVKELKQPFKEVAALMMPGFSDDDYVQIFRECYPHLWSDISIKHTTYQKADERLVKRGKKRRYKFPKPSNFILYKAAQVIQNERDKHAKGINVKPEHIDQRKAELIEAAQCVIAKRKAKQEQKLKYVQSVRPEYSGYLLGKYLRHRRTHPEDVDTCYMYLHEASKYKCRDTIDLLQKVNAVERNYYLRHFAFLTLQKFGIKEVQLRKNPKGKPHPGDKIEPNKMETPEELLSAIYNSQLERYKTFDLFLSHSSRDIETLLRIKTMLNSQGVNVYIDWVNDRDQLRRELTNKDTAKVIIERIKASNAMMYINTEAGASSQWTPWELGYADAIGKKICVLQIEEVDASPAYLDIYDNAYIKDDSIYVESNGTKTTIREWVNR